MTITIKQALHNAIAQLSTDEAKLEAQLLLQQVLQVNHAWLITHADDALSHQQASSFNALIEKRRTGQPIAYILGNREFYGLNLQVTPDTLIPRPDTETLVEAAINCIAPTQLARVLDLGTGSGAIALAIASQRPLSKVLAVDASQAALTIAQANAKQHQLSQIEFILSDWFSAINEQAFDVIASNPPYIESNDAHLSQGDLRFEPVSALASGIDGLDDIRQIVARAPKHLKPEGWLMLEHGYNQAKVVAKLMTDAGLIHIKTLQDLGGNDRVTMGQTSPL